MISAVTKIALSFSHPNRWPVGWVELACGHTSKLHLRDEIKSAHDHANQITKVGDEVACANCDHQAASMARLRAFDRSRLRHSRFRHHDSRGFGPGSHYVYERDDKSPTGCKLLLSLDDTPEAVALIREVLGTSSLSPTEGR